MNEISCKIYINQTNKNSSLKKKALTWIDNHQYLVIRIKVMFECTLE